MRWMIAGTFATPTRRPLTALLVHGQPFSPAAFIRGIERRGSFGTMFERGRDPRYRFDNSLILCRLKRGTERRGVIFRGLEPFADLRAQARHRPFCAL